MKKFIFLISVIICISSFVGCDSNTDSDVISESNVINEKTDVSETGKNDDKVTIEIKVVNPLPETFEINNLKNCSVPVSFEKGDAYVDDSGKMVMNVKVYSYELYDMVDIAELGVNDVIVRRGEETKIESIDRLDTGLVCINGGEENGGFDLYTADNTVYFEIGIDNTKKYYEISEVTLPVSVDFVYYDMSDIDNETVEYYPGDFLTDDSGIEYDFNPYNTTIVTVDGVIVEMIKEYTT